MFDLRMYAKIDLIERMQVASPFEASLRQIIIIFSVSQSSSDQIGIIHLGLVTV